MGESLNEQINEVASQPSGGSGDLNAEINQVANSPESMFDLAAHGLDGAQAVSDTGNAMLASAKAKSFAVDPDAGKRIASVLDDAVDDLNTSVGLSHNIARQPQLGQTPVALIMEPFEQSCADDGDQSLLPNVRLAIDGLGKMATAVRIAMTNYRDTDMSDAHGITSAGGSAS